MHTMKFATIQKELFEIIPVTLESLPQRIIEQEEKNAEKRRSYNLCFV